MLSPETSFPTPAPDKTQFGFALVSRALAIAAILLGVAVLLGWLFHLDWLKRLVPGLVAMNPATAYSFILAGISLALWNVPQPNAKQRAAAQICASVVLLVGLLKVWTLIGGPDSHADQWLFATQLAEEKGLPNRMAPNTALSFCLASTALLLLGGRAQISLWAAQIVALATTLFAMLALLGYFYSVRSLYGVGVYIPMALHTAGGFLLMGTGLLMARANQGLMAPLTSYSAGGTMARRLLPAAIAVPIVFGWLIIEGERAGLFQNEFGAALFVVAIVFVFGALIWWCAGLLLRIDRARQKAVEIIRETSAQLETSHSIIARKNAEMEADLDLAREIQQAFLPQQYITLPRASAPADCALRFHHRYEPATALGGDFSDILLLSDTQAGIFICDVMGHGVRSALVTAIVRGLAEETMSLSREPGQFLTAINRSLMAILQRTKTPLFASAFYLFADVGEGKIRFASAGHPSPLLARCDTGEIRALLPGDQGSGPALGVFDDAFYQTHESALAPRDFVVFYTDGLVEVANDEGEEYGEERMQTLIARQLQLAPAALLDELLREARDWAANGLFDDDICLVGMEVARSGPV